MHRDFYSTTYNKIFIEELIVLHLHFKLILQGLETGRHYNLLDLLLYVASFSCDCCDVLDSPQRVSMFAFKQYNGDNFRIVGILSRHRKLADRERNVGEFDSSSTDTSCR